MTKTRSTKRALLVSALALIICIAMLVGTTFAWFTDSVTSANNKIVAGKLDIQLWMDTGDGYEDISASTESIFNMINNKAQNVNSDTLWEPGKTQVAYLKIVNAGSLALKYSVALKITDVEKNLHEVMQYAITPNAIFGDVNAWNAAAGKAVVLGTQTVTDTDVVMNPGDEHCFALSIHMLEEAGNEYQGGSLNFDLTVLAGQATVERDSFGTDYDKDSEYAVSVSDADGLMAALKLGGNVILTDDIVANEQLEIPAGVETVLNLNGKTITGDGSFTTLYNEGTATIKGGTLKNTGVNGKGCIYNVGTMTLDDVAIVGAPIGTTGYPSYAMTNAGKLTVEDGTSIVSDRGAITTSSGSDITINGGDFSVTDALGTRVLTAHVIYAYGSNTTLTINGGNFAMNYAAAQNAGASVICPAGATIEVYGGNFTYAGTKGGQSGVFQNYMGYGVPVNVYGGTYNDTTVKKNLATGYVAVDNGNGTYTVVKGVSNAAELEKALKNGGNVVLANDITLTKTLQANKDVVIDLNGCTVDANMSQDTLFQSLSGTKPSMIITSSKSGAKINAGGKSVLLGYGSTEISNVEINVGEIKSSSYTTFKVYGDLTLGEGTVVNVDYLGTSLISNNAKKAIVIDGAQINVGTFKVNGGAMISLQSGTTLALKGTEVKVGLDTTYTSYFISRAENATIEGCTFDVKGTDGNTYGIEFRPDASVGDKYVWVQK